MKPGVTMEDLRQISEKSRAPDEEWRALVACVPPSWSMKREDFVGGTGQVFTRGGLQVILSLTRYDDGNLWIHVSVCGRKGGGGYYLPDREQVRRVKNDFVGENHWAYEVWPPVSEYVNDNPYVLHLFARWDRKPGLPDFTHGIGTL